MDSLKEDLKPSFKNVVGAWDVLHRGAGLSVIRTQHQHRRITALADQIVDEIGSDQKHPLAKLLDLVTSLIEQYEAEHIAIPDAAPAEVLAFLMQEHGLKQSDLRAEVGTQGVVSEVLKGKRAINARQAKALAERFGVSAAVFL